MISDSNLSISELDRLQIRLFSRDLSFKETVNSKLREIIERKQNLYYSELNLQLIHAIFDENYRTEKIIISQNSPDKIKIFKSILSNGLIEKNIVTSNNKAYHLASFINREYLKDKTSHKYQQNEIDNIKKLISKINSLSKKTVLDKIDTFKIKHLLKILDDLLKFWEHPK